VEYKGNVYEWSDTMTKKPILIMAMALLMSGFIFAQEEQPLLQNETENANAKKKNDFSLSAGVGGLFQSSFDIERMQRYSAQATVSGGVTAFFDATYAEAGIDMLWGSQLPPIYPEDPESGSMALTHIGFSLYGKYPFVLKRITIYPMLGIDYHMFLSAQMKDADGNNYDSKIKRGDTVDGKYNAEDSLDYLSIGLGFGMDFPLPKSFFVRSEILISYAFDSRVERDRRKNAKDYDYDYLSIVFGPSVKLAVGYRF
jgi:hypothetical protein